MSDAKAVVIRYLQEEDRRGSPAEELCGEGYVAHLAGFPAMDVQGHIEFSKDFYGAFEGFTHHIEDVISNGDRVALRLRLTGVQTGTWMDNPPSGKSVDIGALAMFTVRDGKVTELRAHFDQVGLMQQIGALPTP